MPKCPQKIRAWPANDGTFECRLDAGHLEGPEAGSHVADGLYHYQSIEWFPGDRREFVGEFIACTFKSPLGAGCLFPNGHPGLCAWDGGHRSATTAAAGPARPPTSEPVNDGESLF